MTFDSTNMTPNGVTAMLQSPLGATSYQRFPSHYQNSLQANLWMPQAQPQYIMPSQMIPSNMDPNTAALQYASPLMHQLTAQMSHLQLGGVSGTGVNCFSFVLNLILNLFCLVYAW